jgi:hypothetical protein
MVTSMGVLSRALDRCLDPLTDALSPQVARKFLELKVLDSYGEVVRPAGELDQWGKSLRAIDKELLTGELVAAGFPREKCP